MLVIVVIATSLAVASVSVWLVPPYLALMAWLLFAPARPRVESGSLAAGREVGARVAVEAGVGAIATSSRDATNRSGTTDGASPSAESDSEHVATETSDADPASPRPRRGKGRGRGRSKANPPAPERMSVTWVRVGPGKFVRVETPESAPAESTDTPSDPVASEVETPEATSDDAVTQVDPDAEPLADSRESSETVDVVEAPQAEALDAESSATVEEPPSESAHDLQFFSVEATNGLEAETVESAEVAEVEEIESSEMESTAVPREPWYEPGPDGGTTERSEDESPTAWPGPFTGIEAEAPPSERGESGSQDGIHFAEEPPPLVGEVTDVPIEGEHEPLDFPQGEDFDEQSRAGSSDPSALDDVEESVVADRGDNGIPQAEEPELPDATEVEPTAEVEPEAPTDAFDGDLAKAPARVDHAPEPIRLRGIRPALPSSWRRKVAPRWRPDHRRNPFSRGHAGPRRPSRRGRGRLVLTARTFEPRAPPALRTPRVARPPRLRPLAGLSRTHSPERRRGQRLGF